jgi:hypothetical protein
MQKMESFACRAWPYDDTADACGNLNAMVMKQ